MVRYKHKALLFFFTLLILISCNQNNSSILEQASVILKNSPDSAFVLLSRIENPYQLEGKEKADYWRIRSSIHYHKYNAMTTDSLILYSLKYYEEAKDTTNLLESYLLVGEHYKWKHQLDSVNYILSLGLDKAIDKKDSTYVSQYLQKLGQNEWSRNKRKKAVEYNKEIIKFDKNNHLAYYIAGLAKDDSTQYNLDKGIELALQQKDTLSAAHYLRNYASITLQSKNYKKTIELVKRTGELSDYYKDFVGNHEIMTELYIETDNLDSAQYYLDKAKKVSEKGSFGGYSGIMLIGTQNYLGVLQAIINTKKNESFDLVPMARFNDSIISETIRKNKVLSEQINERANLEKQNLNLLINKQHTQIGLITIFAFIILLSIVIYVFNQKRKRKLEEAEERAESLQKLFKEALSVKDEKQNNSQLFRKTLLQQLGIIKLVATTSSKQSKGLLPQIIDISNESVSTDSLLDWKDLYSIIDSIYDNFYTRLQEKYGSILIEKEIQLCCLLCAEFSTIEISAIMQQSVQTIYQRKSTVRNKLNIVEKEDIISFLDEQI